MPFPLSYTSQVEVPFDSVKHTPEKLLSCIVARLREVRAKNIRDDKNHITFTGGIFRFASNWNILASVTNGSITVVKNQDKLCLNYTLKFTQIFIFATIGVVGFFGPAIWHASNLSTIGKIGILTFAWSWLFGGNYLITILRFPGFIRKMTQTHQLIG